MTLMAIMVTMNGYQEECRQLKVSKVLQRASPLSGRRILPVQSQ
jgi:hypothetical protein